MNTATSNGNSANGPTADTVFADEVRELTTHADVLAWAPMPSARALLARSA
ncbi:hypothetical protein I6F26_33355 [Ensifer sp. IC3342]|nr:hypothetical protein [Ensifer sp. BRP08]MCA1451312.1 hypothetical protein [Ensifer sp. IC3342]